MTYRQQLILCVAAGATAVPLVHWATSFNLGVSWAFVVVGTTVAEMVYSILYSD